VYRVLRKAFARDPFDGEGAFRYGGRWSSPGTRLVYTSEHQSLAMLEYFVHVDADDPPPELVLASAEIPSVISREEITIENLPGNWRETPAPAALAGFGDDFVRCGAHAILVVPSALSPAEKNWLLNPAHADFRKVSTFASEPLTYDNRLLQRRSRRQKHKS
jgi:RES domain-containing protein